MEHERKGERLLSSALVAVRVEEHEKYLHALKTARNECVVRLQHLAAQKAAGVVFDEGDW